MLYVFEYGGLLVLRSIWTHNTLLEEPYETKGDGTAYALEKATEQFSFADGRNKRSWKNISCD